MRLHANARTTPRTRLELAYAVREEGLTPAEAAASAGVSVTTVRKWLARFDAEGAEGLLDRGSRPRVSPRATPEPVVTRVLELRRRRLVAAAIAQELRLARSTVGAILRRHGLGRLPRIEPPSPVRRYEHAAPGDLLHVDTKKLARFARAGHRVHGDRRRHSRGAGWEFAHVAVDDHSRVAFVEVLPDETGPTTAAFLLRAVAFFARQGVRVRRLLSDNGSNYRSRDVRDLCTELGVDQRFTRPYTPRTNGKAERLVQTLLREWAYVRPYADSGASRAALRPYLRHYNRRRPHCGIGRVTPLSRLRKAETTS